MKGLSCILIAAISCQSLLCEEVSDADPEKSTGDAFVQGEFPRDISKDKIRTHFSTKVNTTHVRIEEAVPVTTVLDLAPLPEVETESQDEPDQPEDEPQTLDEPKSQAEPHVEPDDITNNTSPPCTIIPCPFSKRADESAEFKTDVGNNSHSKPKVAEFTSRASEECQLSLELYHTLSFQLLLISLFCFTMILLLIAIFVAMYLTKNGLGFKKFKKLESRDCGLNKYNF